jgi:hypothetical protein
VTPDRFAGTWRLTGWVRLLGAALLLPVEMRAATRVRTVSTPTLPPGLAVLADESAEVLYRPAEPLPTPQEPRRLTADRDTTNLPQPPTAVVTRPAETAPKD